MTKIVITAKTMKVGNALYLLLPKIIHENYKLQKNQELKLVLSDVITVQGFKND